MLKQFRKQLTLLRDFLTNQSPPNNLFEVMNLATEALSLVKSDIRILFYMVSIPSDTDPLELVPCPVRQLTSNAFAYDPLSHRHKHFAFETNNPHWIPIALSPDYVFGLVFLERADTHPLSELERYLAALVVAHTAVQLPYLWCKNTATITEETAESTSLVLDQIRCQVWIKGIPVRLSRNEFTVFRILYRHHGHICRRDLICRAIYTDELLAPNDRQDRLDVLISRLRTKLNGISNNEVYIETIRGVGYQLRLQL